MKQSKYLFICMLLVFVGCMNNKKGNSADDVLLFDVEKAAKLEEISLLSPEHTIKLAFSDSTMIDDNAALLYDETYFIYSRGSIIPPMRFDADGKFLNYIGRVGNGPEEFYEIGDVCLNKRERTSQNISNGGCSSSAEI